MVASVIRAYGVAVGADHFAFGYLDVYVIDFVGAFYHVGYFGYFGCSV